MAAIIEIVKPCRHEEVLLTPERVYMNLSRGYQTALLFDLNILNIMKEVVLENQPINKGGLYEFIQLLKSAPFTIAPGFAIEEADEEYINELRACYEKFANIYLPRYINTPSCLHKSEQRKRSRYFTETNIGEQYRLLITYVSMLAMQIVGMESQNCTQEDRFTKFVNYMETHADVIPAIECEIARYYFFDRSDVLNQEFKNRCAVIRKNFSKGGKGKRRLQYTMNYARDVAYYRYSAMSEGTEMDNLNQEIWLVTADAAISALSKSIHYVSHENDTAKYVNKIRNTYQKSSSFWNYTDDYVSDALERRAKSGINTKPADGESWARLRNCCSVLENKMYKYWPEQPNV